MRFSIILPVFNAGKYLHKAVLSVLEQSFTDFELILVDDGSTDDSPKVCQEFAARDTRVVYCRKTNGGISDARNFGMRIARGEYIGFCDHDDEYLPEYLITVDAALSDHGNPDIVKVNRENYRRWSNGKVEKSSPAYACSEGWWNPDEYKDSQLRSIISVVWNGFYRREWLIEKGLRFEVDISVGGEDIKFNLKALSNAKTLWHCGPRCYYRHYDNFGKSTSCKSHPELVEIFRESACYEIAHFKLLDENVGSRFSYWTNLLASFVFFAMGNRLGVVAMVRIMSDFARMLLPACVSASKSLESWMRWMVRNQHYCVIGWITLLMYRVFRTRAYCYYARVKQSVFR